MLLRGKTAFVVVAWLVVAAWSSGRQLALEDDSGVRVALAAPARRIVSLAPSNTESLFAMGAGELIVGVTRFDDFPAEARAITQVGGFSDVDVERVLKLEPDLVLAAGFHASGVVPRLRSLGLTVFVVEPRDAAEVLDRLLIIGRLVGRVEEARELEASLRQRLVAVQERVGAINQRPRVFYLLSRDLFTVGPGSFAHDLIGRAGGQNIAADATISYPQMSDEAVIARDPEVIFIGGHDSSVDLSELRRRPGWARVSAVASGRVVVLEDVDLISRPGPRIVEALEIMARALHPIANDAKESDG